MGVEAARLALRATDVTPDRPWCSAPSCPPTPTRPTPPPCTPPCGCPTRCRRSTWLPRCARSVGGLRFALTGAGTTPGGERRLRTGLAGSADEAAGGDAAAALLVGEGDGVVAEYLGGASGHRGVPRSLAPARRHPLEGLGRQVLRDHLRRPRPPGLQAGPGRHRAGARPTSTPWPWRHPPPASARPSPARLGVEKVAADLTDVVGATGAAQPGLLLAGMLEDAEPGQVLALVVLADGAEVFVFRTTDAHRRPSPRPSRSPPRSRAERRSPTTASSRGGA